MPVSDATGRQRTTAQTRNASDAARAWTCRRIAKATSPEYAPSIASARAHTIESRRNPYSFSEPVQ
ncbi:hypothetical protein ADM96_15970 [Burkholderia sp. ST111]|nr:hypothetical protein ADM96_15970 [Burkholderia sp. ST111]